MRYVAAAALAALGGGEVNEANIKKILRWESLDLFSITVDNLDSVIALSELRPMGRRWRWW